MHIKNLERPRGFQEVETLRFQDNQHRMLVRLSALRTGRLYFLGNILELILVESNSIARLQIFMSMKMPRTPSGIEL